MVASEPNRTLAANRRSASDARGCTTILVGASCMLQESEPGPLSLAHLGHLSTGRHAKSSSATRGTIRPAVSPQLGPNEIKERTKNRKGGYQWQRSYLLQQTNAMSQHQHLLPIRQELSEFHLWNYGTWAQLKSRGYPVTGSKGVC